MRLNNNIFCFLAVIFFLLKSSFSFSFVSSNSFIRESDSLLRVLEKTTDTEKKLSIYYELGYLYESNNLLKEAAEIYEKALNFIDADGGFEEEVPKLCFLLGSAYMNTGFNNKSLPVLYRGFNVAEKYNQKEMSARILISIGVLYYFLHDVEQALYYYKQALRYVDEIDNDIGKSIVLNNIANIYQIKGDASSAINYYTKAMDIQKTAKDTSSICNILLNMASVYNETKKFDKAEKLLNEAYNLAVIIDDKEQIAMIYLNMGLMHSAINNYYLAQNMFDKALEIASENDIKNVELEVLKKMEDFYYKNKNYENAYSTLKKISVIEIETRTKELSIDRSRYDAMYKNADKRRQIAEQQQRLRTARIIIAFIICFIVLFVVFNIILLRVLSERKKYIDKLEDLNLTKDKLISIISHDLRTPALAQKIAINNVIEFYNDLDDESRLNYIKLIYEGAENQIDLVENMLSWAKIQTGKIKFNPINFDLYEVIKEVMSLYAGYSSNKKIVIETNLNESLYVFADRIMISTVIRNLVNNSLKFSYPDSVVRVNVDIYDEKVVVSVVDFGKGMTESQVENIFRLKGGTRSEGTSGEKGSGIGLTVCKEMIEEHNSKLIITSKLGEGTIVSFELKRENYL